MSKAYDGERVPWTKTVLVLIDIYKGKNDSENEIRVWLPLIGAFQEKGDQFLEQIAVIHGRIALLYRINGKLDVAVEHAKKTFETFKRIQPPKPYDLLLMESMYGTALQNRGRLRAASEILERNLPKIKANPAGQQMATRIQLILGVLYFHWQKPDRASAHLEWATKELDKILVGGVEEGVLGLTCLAKIRMQQKKHAEAEKLILRGQGLIQDSPMISAAFRASTLRDIALLYVIKGDFPRATTIFKKAKKLLTQKGLDNTLAAATLSSVHAQVEFQTGNKANAVAELEKALATQLKNLPHDHPAVVETLEAKLFMLNALGKRKEATETETKLKVLRQGFEK